MLVFKNYDCDFDQAVRHGNLIDITHCLRSTAAGLVPFHSIGFVHSDIKPENIFVLYSKAGVETAAQYVIRDFESVQSAGHMMMGKTGTPGWARLKKQGDVVEEKDDWYAFRQLKKWLIASQNADVMGFASIGRSTEEKKAAEGMTRRMVFEVRG